MSKPETTDVAYTKMKQDGHAKQNNYKADDLESFYISQAVPLKMLVNFSFALYKRSTI